MSARDNKKQETTTSAASAAAAAGDESNTKQNNKASRGGKDGDRPQTTRGRGQRGGYGKGRGDRRPQTAKDEGVADNDDARGGYKGNRGRGGRQGNNRQGQDPDSWINKFHSLQKPVFNDSEVTLDTEIPERPTKD